MRTGTVDLLDWVRTDELAELAGVHRTTAARWRRRELACPPAVLKLLELTFGGHVGPCAGPDWRGWYFDPEGRLNPPTWRAPIAAAELAGYLLLRRNGTAPEAIAALYADQSRVARALGFLELVEDQHRERDQ